MSRVGLVFFCLFGMAVTSMAFATPSAELGKCLLQGKNSASEESHARRETEKAGLSGQEVLARLIFSEALSTGYWNSRCNAPSGKALMESIGWGILNRVQMKKSEGFFTVIFEKNQFRTSFSQKKKNPFAASFLCPISAQAYLKQTTSRASAQELFHQAQQVALEVTTQWNQSDIPSRFQGIAHFFYPKSEFFGEIRPPWAKDPNPEKNKGYRNLLESKNPCVEFYLADK